MKAVALKAQPRSSLGKQAAGRLRRGGAVPGIVYGADHAAQLVQLNEHDLVLFLKGHTSEHFLVDLTVEGGQPCKALIKEIQRHPVSGRIEHVDFNAVSMTRKLRVEVPVKLLGEPTGVAQQGGVLDHIMRTILVECLPADIPEQLTLDVSALNIGQRLTVADVQVDKSKVTVLSAGDQPIAAVAAPRAEEEVAPTAAEAAAAAEPEVLTAKKPEEGEADAAGAEGKEAGKKEAGKPAPAEKGGAEAAKKGKEEAKKK
jgi:large subunit ribosomal protein L25